MSDSSTIQNAPPLENHTKTNDNNHANKSVVSNREDIVKFNIGGTLFSTVISTITKPIPKSNKNHIKYYEPHLLARLITTDSSDAKYDHDNKAIFIDRNPHYFNYILDFLRLGSSKFRIRDESQDVLNEIYEEAEFYQVEALIDTLVPFRDSKILTTRNAVDLVNLCGFSIPDQWRLLYRGGAGDEEDKFDQKTFQSKCERVPQSLIIAKSKGGSIFGCYTEKGYNSSNGKKGNGSGTVGNDNNSFLFSLISNEDVDFAFFKANVIEVYSRTLPSIIRV